MAKPVTRVDLGAWRGEGVRVGEVLEALAELRRGEQRTATRTAVVNLVMVAGGEHEAEEACAAVHKLGARHPGRSIVLLPDEGGGPAGIDAEVILHGSEAEGRAVWSEDVRLRVRGPVAGHLDSLIEPLTLPDLPVVVWFVGYAPRPADPLLAPADAVLVDAKDLGGRRAFAALANLGRRHAVVDLSWIRLRPWRELLAGLFEVPAFRPFVSGVRAARVEGKLGPRDLLAGWLASRLDLSPPALQLADGRHLSVRLEADHAGDQASFVVGRADGERLVRAKAEVAGAPPHEDRLSLADDPLPWSLAEALTNLRRDRVQEAALQAALGLEQ